MGTKVIRYIEKIWACQLISIRRTLNSELYISCRSLYHSILHLWIAMICECAFNRKDKDEIIIRSLISQRYHLLCPQEMLQDFFGMLYRQIHYFLSYRMLWVPTHKFDFLAWPCTCLTPGDLSGNLDSQLPQPHPWPGPTLLFIGSYNISSWKGPVRIVESNSHVNAKISIAIEKWVNWAKQ